MYRQVLIENDIFLSFSIKTMGRLFLKKLLSDNYSFSDIYLYFIYLSNFQLQPKLALYFFPKFS